MTIVNLDGVDNAAGSAAGGLTKGVTVGGFNPGDTLTFTMPTSGGGEIAWSAWTTPRFLNVFHVIRDGDPGSVVARGDGIQYVINTTARDAFNALPAAQRQIAGASSYTFYLQDVSPSDNSGGLTIDIGDTPALVEQGIARTIRAVFFRLDTDPPLRLWTGINDIGIGIDVVDEAGSVYLGAGRLLDVPDLEVLINGLADRVDIFLPGVSVEAANRVAAGAPSVQGLAVNIGVATLDDRYQPLTSIIPVWYGLADLWSMAQTASADPASPPTRTLALSVGAGRTGRARARRAAYTPAQQKLLFPTDEFCEFVSRYTSLYEVKWPDF
jgi:hypothetical protein